MNPVGFVVVLWVVLGLDWGLRSSLELGSTGIVPSLLAVLLTFVCVRAPKGAALWSAIVIGVLIDLLRDVSLDGRDETTVVVGPAAVGAMAAAALVLNVRGLLYQRNVVSIAILSGFAAVLMNLTAAMLLVIRSRVDDVIAPGSQLSTALGSAVYTAVVALLVLPVLMAVSGLMGLRAERRSRFQIS